MSCQLIDSTAAARVSGYLGGYGRLDALRAAAKDLSLSPEAKRRLLDLLPAR